MYYKCTSVSGIFNGVVVFYSCSSLNMFYAFVFPGEPLVRVIPVVTENPLPKDALSSTGKP